MGISLTGFSMPIFWWGLLLIILFSGILQWTPVSGRISLLYFVEAKTGFMLIDSLLSDEEGAFRSALSHLILPAIVLGTVPLAVIARQTRSAMLEVLGEDYVRTARAKGLPPSRVIGLHALRNALIPVVTVIGLLIGTLFGGAILTETIFAWPGVGKWLVDFDRAPRLPLGPGRGGADRQHRHAGQSRRRPALRPDQPPHPARELSHGRTRRRGGPCRARCRSACRPRGWPSSGTISARTTAPSPGLAVIVAGGPGRDLRRRDRPARPALQNRDAFLLPPAWQAGGYWSFPLGTDAVGRDILSRLIYGARFSLLIGAIVITLSLSVGVVLGLVAGFARGWVETMIMRLMDIILALPSLLLAIVIVAILGPGPASTP